MDEGETTREESWEEGVGGLNMIDLTCNLKRGCFGIWARGDSR